MAILKFDKHELTNLEYSLSREFISTNRAGGYMSTTIVCCNTRKYHGLMVCPIDNYETQNFVLLSSLDETIIQHGQSFNLAIHAFPNVFEPKGHKYIRSFEYTPTPTLIYRVGDVVVKKELLWLHNKQRLLIRYTLIEATSQTTLRLRPYLAFRQTHTLSKANMFADGRSTPIKGGVKNRLYEDFPYLHLQLNCENEFYPAPDWYYNFEYKEEDQRGYQHTEDLLTTGVFEVDFTKNQSIIISCSLNEIDPAFSNEEFEKELARRSEKIEFIPCLLHSARQFIIKQGEETKLIAGYPWFERRGRDTFIATPWLTLTQNNTEDCLAILHSEVAKMRDGLFQCFENLYESADTSLWFFNALQQTEKVLGNEIIWEQFGNTMMEIIDAYASKLGSRGIEMHDNGLIWAYKQGEALTWMDMYADGRAVTPRSGYAVEINAMWYNAICYTLLLAKKHNEKEFVRKWKEYPKKIKESFNKVFWMESEGYYADYVNEEERNTQIRPNQLIGCALPYKVADPDNIKAVIDIIDKHLLTKKGIRTLSPNDKDYIGNYGGDEKERALSHHQGTTRAWLLPYYFAANLAIYGKEFQPKGNELISGFEENFLDYGIGTISELCDGNPPHKPGGAVSQAISVGAVLRMIQLIKGGK
ncbi:MAG: amylo-alpha-1,6-glucosidase [Rikenellaceae bacterium]